MTDEPSALESAIVSGDSLRVASFLETGSIDLNARLSTNRNHTPLTLAARHGHDRVVEALLDAGADINVRDAWNRSPCIAAAQFGHAVIVELLVARGCDLAATDEDGGSALFRALLQPSDRLALSLISAGAPLSDPVILCRAAAMSPATLQLLLDRHIDVAQLRDSDDNSPVHWAAMRNDRGAVAALARLVREIGIDVNVRNRLGLTPCHCSTISGSFGPLRWLVEADADIECVGNEGLTPLLYACSDNRIDCALLLIVAGANVDAIAEHARSRSWVFARSLLHALVAAGADLSAIAMPSADEIALARRHIGTFALTFVRERAFQVCLGLHSRQLDALQMCEVLLHACGPVAPSVPFHRWWQIATAAKHFQSKSKPMVSV
jgi:ankyrin repeat protein